MMSDKCVNPNAPVEFCLYCGKEVHTCELDESVNNSYLCPVHPSGFQDKYGNWFCCDVCYKEAERINKKLEEITPSNKELLKMVEYQEKFKVYKSVTELCAENPNLLEYIEQLEKNQTRCCDVGKLSLSENSYWHTVDFAKDGSMIEGAWYLNYKAPEKYVELDGTFSIEELECIVEHMKKVSGAKK